ncbi:MAG: PorT family protein [Bacteroidota bacterium]|nr:PorT family protein [Bacteroidota bacterium]
MWSDNDIDDAFRRLDSAEPEPTPFPLDAWLKLEAGLDQAVIDRAVRHRLWQFFAAEMAIVALVGLGWSLWPAGAPVSAASKAQTAAATTLPAHKAANAKRLPGSETSKAGASSARPTVGNMALAMPRLAPTPAATASMQAPTTAAAPVSPASAAPGVGGHGQHLPLAVALVPGHYPRFHSAEDRLAASGHGAAAAGAAAGYSESTSAARAVKSPAATHSLAIAASAAEASARTQTLSDAQNARNLATANQLAGRPMALPSQVAAGGVVVADAASPGGGAPDIASGTSRLAAASASTGADNPSNFNLATAASAPAAMDGLSPVVASMVNSAQPTAEPLPAQLQPIAVAATPLPAGVYQPRFYVGVVAAPDVSTVKFADVQGAHLNLGLTLEYRLGQRWRLATGLQRATKDYYARRDDYDFSGYPKAYTRDFNWVDASCTIFDVPLNLRYDAVVGPRYRLFGAAGLSSFFMHREQYTYDYYDNASNAPAVWERSFVNANQHLVSILNLSAGYEYGLGTHWRVQAEPYVKVPLAGVGAGKVKLLSAGVYFGLKYGF